VSNVDQVIALAGRGSMLHRQALAFFANNRFTDCYIGILADNGAGVAATGPITITGPATAAGTISLYLGGNRVAVSVASGDTAAAIATAISAAINAAADLPVTASPASAVVTVTHRHKGEVGNEYDMRVNYQDGEATAGGRSPSSRSQAARRTPR
jgi:phage tail sheath gpL-like